jgi:hypothetical protein
MIDREAIEDYSRLKDGQFESFVQKEIVANKSINRQTLNLAQMFVKQIKDSKPQTNPYAQYLERIVTIIKK